MIFLAGLFCVSCFLQLFFSNQAKGVLWKMGSNKSSNLKAVLSKALSQNRRVPLFVIAKTKRRVSRNVKQRNWRSSKLKVKVK